MQTSAVQVFLAVINLILCTQRMPCENNISTCIGSILAVTILVLEVRATFCVIASLKTAGSCMRSAQTMPFCLVMCCAGVTAYRDQLGA